MTRGGGNRERCLQQGKNEFEIVLVIRETVEVNSTYNCIHSYAIIYLDNFRFFFGEGSIDDSGWISDVHMNMIVGQTSSD